MIYSIDSDREVMNKKVNRPKLARLVLHSKTKLKKVLHNFKFIELHSKEDAN